MRAEFEAWYRNEFAIEPDYVLKQDADTYRHTWKSWLAALSAPPANNPWQQAIDDELINAHLGVANNQVTREEAKSQLNNLITWHIDVAKYFESQAQKPAQEEINQAKRNFNAKGEM